MAHLGARGKWMLAPASSGLVHRFACIAGPRKLLGEVERGSACVHLQLLRYCKVPTGEWRRHGLIFFFFPP